MSSNNNRDMGNAPLFHKLLSTGLYTGRFPWGSGTVAGLEALTIWIILFYNLSPMMLAITNVALVVVTLFVGVWTDNVMEKYLGEDPRIVIIDEYFGTWVATLAALFCTRAPYLSVSLASIAFILFRVIDITKPLGCRWVDQHIHGGWGCMLDDALAGFYAIILTLIIRHLHIVEMIHYYL